MLQEPHNLDTDFIKDDSDYLAFKETTWSYNKFVYQSSVLCEPVPPHSQPIQICCVYDYEKYANGTTIRTSLIHFNVQVF